MKNKLWEAVYEVFQEVHAEGAAALEAERIIELRKRLRVKLDFLRAQLAERLTEREIYYILFPVVVYLDEIIQTKILPGERVEWVGLQKELFGIDTGGNVFYEVIDDLLRKPETYPFIYEVFYFCLSDGFVGRYKGQLVKLNEYKDKLHKRIVVPDHEPYEEEEADFEPIRFERSPIGYYLATVVILIASYYGFVAFAQYESIIPAAGN